MMAFDRMGSFPSLDPATINAVRAALTQSVALGSHTEELREALCTVAREARDKGIHPEPLLATLKEIWHSLPSVASSTSSAAKTALLQDLISRCIQEYYAT
jgi:hypothetical protein